jgi:Glycosyl hydrolase family 79 C-terminal beta domain
VTTGRTAAGAATCLALLATSLVLPAAAPAKSRLLARVEAKKSTAGKRVPRSFLGLSAEYDSVHLGVSLPRSHYQANPIFVQLVRNLGAFGGGVPTLRIGGVTSDSIYVPNASGKHPPGTIYPINDRWLGLMNAFATASGAPLIVGVNLALNRPSLAASFARLVVQSMPPHAVRAFEIGNEPDLYVKRPFYPGRQTRSRSWSPRRYIPQLKSYLGALHKAVPSTTLAGPAMVVNAPKSVVFVDWAIGLPFILKAGRGRMNLMTVHRYPLLTCGKSKRLATVDRLLSHKSVDGQFKAFAYFARLARKNHMRLRLTESNSVACGGRKGVSDVFASALWGVDWMFLLAGVGADGVDFHTASRAYTPFLVFHDHGRHGAKVQPLYYAMQVFAEATAHRARILRSTYRAGLGFRGHAKGRFHAWATYDSVDRVVRVVIVNKTRRAGDVEVHVPGAEADGVVKRLTAAKVTSRKVTWGGQAYARPTYSGLLKGTPRLTTVRRSKARFRVKMPGTGIAMLTVPVRSR